MNSRRDMETSEVQASNLCTEGTPEEYLAMAYRMGKEIVRLKGCTESLTAGEWKIELDENALVALLVQVSTADYHELMSALSEKLLSMEQVGLRLVDGKWKMEFTHVSLAGLCLWAQKYSA
jgi:hypothetical protein